jgi:hypothetical protein
MIRPRFSWAVLALSLSLCPVAGLAQVSSSGLTGTVTDPSGLPVAAAHVTVKSEVTGIIRTAVTDHAGGYVFSDLTPGVYEVTAEGSGFKKTVVSGTRLFVGQVATLGFNLELGPVTQSVSVIAEAPLIQDSSSQVGTVIETKLLTELPLNGRNFLQLNLLSPGVTRSKNGNTFDSLQIDPTAASFNVNGQKGDYNLYLLDGIPFKEYEGGTNTFSPSVDAVQEFQVATSNYSAAFGSEAGAQVNLVTRSGSNQVHGGLYEFLRNSDLDARNFFASTQGAPPFRRNQFGGTLGGPVFVPKLYDGREKTFLFFGYEGFRERKTFPLLGNFPTPAQLDGDLSSLTAPGKTVIDPTSGASFPNNRIPQARMPSTLLPFLKSGIGNGPWLPVPNASTPGFDYYRDDSQGFDSDQYIARIDQKLGAGTLLYGHFVRYNGSKRNVNLNPNWHLDQVQDAQSASGHLSQVLTPRLLMEVSAGYSSFSHGDVQSTAFKNDISNQTLQLRGVSTIPQSWGAPAWSVTGFSALGEYLYGARRWPLSLVEVRPAFTYSNGPHNLKFGIDILHNFDNFQEVFRANGSWNFDGSFTGQALGDFLLGLPASVNTSPDGFSPEFRYSGFSPYFQDDWRVTSNLTLNLGLRYEWHGVPASSNHTLANIYFPPGGNSPMLVVSDNVKPINFLGEQQTLWNGVAYMTASQLHLPQSLEFNDNINLAPRFGFAWRIPGTHSTVLRGGYGVFYQRDTIDKWVEAAINPPFVRSVNTVLDKTNFQSFDWFEPAKGASASVVQLFGNGINYRDAMIQSWNGTLERTVRGILVSAAYVGNKGQHLPSLALPNQSRPGPGSFVSRKPWPEWGTLYAAGYDGNSTYHSGQLKAQKAFTRGFSFLAGYTWSKAIDDTGGTLVGEADRGGAFQDSNNRRAEKGLAGQDIRHRFVLSSVYELPFGKGRAWLHQGGMTGLFLGGWQINGIVAAQTGSPFTVTQSFNGANTDSGQRRPDVIGNPNISGGGSVTRWFDTSAFRENRPADLVNGPFRFGNVGRHIVVGPGLANLDFAAYKEFQVAERCRLQFRGELFNILNHPSFGNPGATLGTPQFGVISSAGDPRDIQFGLKLTY